MRRIPRLVLSTRLAALAMVTAAVAGGAVMPAHAQTAGPEFCKALADTSQELTVSALAGQDRGKALQWARASTLAVHTSPQKVEALVNHIFDRKKGPVTEAERGELEAGCLLQEEQGRKAGKAPAGLGAASVVSDVSPHTLVSAAELLIGAWATLTARGFDPKTAQEMVSLGEMPQVPAPFPGTTLLSDNKVTLPVSEELCRAVLRKSTGLERPEVPKWQPSGALYGCYLSQGLHRFYMVW